MLIIGNSSTLGIWEFKKVLVVFVAISLLSTGFVVLSEEVFADKKGKKNTTKIINLGILQTAAHDFYNFDRSIAFENENGKLDLSTVLFEPKSGDCTFEDAIDEENEECVMRTVEEIRNGGERRNSENIMIFTASSALGEKYLDLKAKHGEEKAYDKILKKYHKQIKKAFEQTFHQKFPKPQEEGVVNNNHNLALRTVHDMLPATIMKEGNPDPVSVFQFPIEKLTKKEQRQQSEPLDGVIDIGFRPIMFCPDGGPICIPILNLLTADQTFGEDHTSSDFASFNELMGDLTDGRYDKDETVTQMIIEQFAMGINLDEDDDDEDDDD